MDLVTGRAVCIFPLNLSILPIAYDRLQPRVTKEVVKQISQAYDIFKVRSFWLSCREFQY